MRLLLLIMFSFLTSGLYACLQMGACTHHKSSNTLIYGDESSIIQACFKEIKTRIDKKTLDLLVLDPGHGGKDHGCTGSQSIEKHITLSLAKEIKTLLELAFPDLQIALTRESDVFMTLSERAEMANALNADLFISLHCNYLRDGGKFNGSETYVMGINSTEENLAIAKRENEVIELEIEQTDKYTAYQSDSPEAHIFLSMYQCAFLENSIRLAQHVERHLGKLKGLRSNGVKQAEFVVLKMTNMPSILIETGYLSNDSDQKLLNSKQGQQELAKAILAGYKDYLNGIKP